MKTISSNFTLSMRNYNENNACNYVYTNICKPPVIIWKKKKKKGYSKSLTLKRRSVVGGGVVQLPPGSATGIHCPWGGFALCFVCTNPFIEKEKETYTRK